MHVTRGRGGRGGILDTCGENCISNEFNKFECTQDVRPSDRSDMLFSFVTSALQWLFSLNCFQGCSSIFREGGLKIRCSRGITRYIVYQ
jgi:hypothetical protein